LHEDDFYKPEDEQVFLFLVGGVQSELTHSQAAGKGRTGRLGLP